MPYTVLIVEDDQKLQEYLQSALNNAGYIVWCAGDTTQAFALLEKKVPDLVLLDLGLPDISGETLCAEIKQTHPDVKVVILTAKDRLNDVIQGFSIGADDYIKKPFQTEELLARIGARFRNNGNTVEIVTAGDLEIHLDTMEVKRSDKVISLTPQEFKLLQYLVVNKGRVLTREMILSRLWGSASDVESRVVDVYIGYLRKKIDSDFDVKLIRSVRGFGYMLKA